MSMLKDGFFEFIKSTDESVVCEMLDCYPSHIKRWTAGTHKPTWDHIGAFVEKVILKRAEALAEKRIQKAVEAAVKELTGDGEIIKPQPVAAPVPPPQDPAPLPAPSLTRPGFTPVLPKNAQQPVGNSLPAPNPIQIALGAQPAPAAAPVALDAVVYKGKATAIKVPKGKEGEYSQKFADWMAANRKLIPESTLLTLTDLYFQAGGRDVAVLFPCHKYTNPATNYAMVALALDMGKEKMRYNSEFGNGCVYTARNMLADWYMNQTTSEWSLWIDDDMIPPIGRPDWFKWAGNMPANYPNEVAGRHLVTRLMSHQKSLIGGCYFSRQFNGNAMYHEGKTIEAEDQRARRMPDEIRATEWVGTGAMLVHRSVYLDIQRNCPDIAPIGARTYWEYFLPVNGQGEDVAFCQRAKKSGHQPFVDLGCQPLHVGYACYGGHNTVMKKT